MVSKIKKRDKYLITAILNILWFTIVVLVLSAYDKTVPSELIVAWFSSWTVELALLAGIKIKRGTYNEETFDE